MTMQSAQRPPDPAGDLLDLEPLPPGRRTVEQERVHRKEQLAITFRIFARYGFDEGIAGHVTVRDPEFPDQFWVNPYAVHFSRITVSDLLLIDERGRVVDGTRRTNKAAFSIHSAIHTARPDVVAVAHTHSLHGRAWAALSRPLDPIVQESCVFWNDHAVFEDYRGLVLDQGEGQAIARALAGHRGVILRHHGLLTVGGSVAQAAWWFITMDRAAQLQLLAEAAGNPRHMSADEARLARRQFGNANMAEHSFNLLADLVREDNPEVLS